MTQLRFSLFARPAQRDLVARCPLGPLEAATLLGAVLLGTDALKLAAGYSALGCWRAADT